MPPRRRIGKRLIKSFLPIALVIVLAVGGALSFVVYCVSRPTRRPYVVTPESFSRISGRAIKVTDETWTNPDGRNARGWLLKGAEGAPAVVLLHRYGGDRSWLFNLGVKINETTNFTILWPDLRGHGGEGTRQHDHQKPVHRVLLLEMGLALTLERVGGDAECAAS